MNFIKVFLTCLILIQVGHILNTGSIKEKEVKNDLPAFRTPTRKQM